MSISIISEKEINGRTKDGINTLVFLDEEDFSEFLNKFKINEKTFPQKIEFYYITDPCKLPEVVKITGLEKEKRWYCIEENKMPQMQEIFNELAKELNKYPEDSIEKKRIYTILNERSIEVLKEVVSKREGFNKLIVDKLFDILIDQDSFSKFLNFEKNRDFFQINGEYSNIKEYLILFSRIFGIKNKDGTLSKAESISETYYIPQLSIIMENAKEIYQRFNIDRYTNPEYEFRNNAPYRNEKIIRQGDEPDWNINPELHDAVYKSMPDDLSLEEKAFYIYTKLCMLLEYDEEYMYRKEEIDSTFYILFSKEHLRDIKPGFKVTCYDFARVYSKFINEVEGDIEAVIISQGLRKGHFLTGFYTDRISTKLEPINIYPFNTNDSTNDITKAKNRIKLNGIKAVSDKDKLIDQSLQKVYNLIYGSNALTMDDYIAEVKGLPNIQETDDIKFLIQAFISLEIERGIKGNEFVQSFEKMRKLGLFGESTETAYIGIKKIIDKKRHIQRMILIRNKQEGNERLFAIDTSSLSLVEPTARIINNGLKSGKLIYEDVTHRLNGIDKGE